MKVCLTEKILATNLNKHYYILPCKIILRTAFLCSCCLFIFLQASAQTIDKKHYERAKKNIAERIYNNRDRDFNDVGYIFEQYIQQNPGNAEAWYFLGYAIDKHNSFNGEEIIRSGLPLAIKASECFQNCLELSNDKYQGERLLLDPHTKILSVWGGQAFRYLYENKHDSAAWCLQQANLRGGINATVLRFYSQLLDDVSDSAYLFNIGDMQAYYIAYLQHVLQARKDIQSINVDYLNTNWYPQYLQQNNVLNIPTKELENIKAAEWSTQDAHVYNLHYPAGDSLLSWQLQPTFENQLLRSDKIMLRILQDNAMRKDVFYPSGLPSGLRLQLNTSNYLQLRGLTVKLNTVKGSNDADYLRARLPALFPLNGQNLSYLNNPDNLQPLNILRFVHAWTAEYALAAGDTAFARSGFALAQEKYPEEFLPFYDNNDKKWYESLATKINLQSQHLPDAPSVLNNHQSQAER